MSSFDSCCCCWRRFFFFFLDLLVQIFSHMNHNQSKNPTNPPRTYTHHFNGHFPGCPLDSQSPVILILSILTWQAKTLHTHMVVCTVLCSLTLNTIPMGFEEDVFTGRMPFQSHNQQHQSTEGMHLTKLEFVHFLLILCLFGFIPYDDSISLTTEFERVIWLSFRPSVLWQRWLGDRKGIQPV